MTHFKNEKGFSIIEIIVSFVIISIIFISFMSLLVQSKKVNVSSEGIQDATYLAQAEMEKIYTIANQQSSLNTFSTDQLQLGGTNYSKVGLTPTATQLSSCQNFNGNYAQEEKLSAVYEASTVSYDLTITIQFTCKAKKNIVGKVEVTVIDPDSKVQKVKIENAYIWK